MINLELSENYRLEIISGSARMKIVGVSSDEYPPLPGIGINVSSRVSASMLLDMINKTVYASSNDEACFNLTGVHFTATENGLRMIATDGHRLSVITREIESLTIPEGVIVPRKGLLEIRKFLSDLADAEIKIGLEEGFFIIDSRDAKFSMRLIDGEFPDYEQVIPSGSTSLANIKSEELSKTLKRVSLLVNDKMKGVRFSFSSDGLHLSSSSPELGSASEDMDLDFNGDNFEVGFNATYVQEFCSSLGENQEIKIELNGETGPGKFYPTNDPDYFGIVMPMRLT